ncbi:anti-sigma factor [Tenuibacillus multivorans]|uniref:anti-sigma factor n=1 Tax=Tenuibacillus multivorans TaxID=237069 RepID=UPI000B82EC26|nr:zf-HC2 domain-containing protein [Tenuibacillus multivorans]GEL77754.1 hypothetical protein TMU01_19890 [Tenuibacillus multivorans]
MTNNHLTDEQFVDYIEGNLEETEHAKVSQHLQDCEECQASYQSWADLLNTDIELNELDRRRVWHGIQYKVQEKEVQQQTWRKRLIYAGWSVSCLLFLIVGYLVGQNGSEQEFAGPMPEGERLGRFMDQPVQHYDMVNSEDGESQGIAWYNPYQKQMILYLNDPRTISDQTQQIQIETLDRVIPIQPNHLRDGRMQFYVRDQDLQDLSQLIVTDDESKEDEQTYYFRIIAE